MALPSGLAKTADLVCQAVAAVASGPLIVALSGGADSAVVAWACTRVRPPGTVRALHIDHGWTHSPELRRAATALAAALELPLEIVAVTPARRSSPEGAARDVRLAALEAAANEERIITGHHADDAAETVITNLLRGAGATGLSGIAPVRLPFVRPLLGMRRHDLRQLARGLGLPFYDDPSNDDLALRRNLVRQELLPALDAQIDGDLVELLGRTARRLAADDAYINDVVPAFPLVEDAGALLLGAALLETLPEVLAGRVARMALRRAHPPYPGDGREVEVVMSVATGRQPRGDLSGGLVAEREGPYVAVYRPSDLVAPSSLELGVPGSVVFGGHELTATPVAGGHVSHMSHDRCRVALSEFDLMVRSPRDGDRVEIATGTKSVADALSEAGIPSRKRSAWPVVESRGRIAWVAGVRVASWARTAPPATEWIELERRSL